LRKFVDPDYNINHYKSITWKEVKDYHEKYYKRENVVVVDEEKNYKVVFE
jgi:CRISPR/Cas system-associated protein Csx1